MITDVVVQDAGGKGKGVFALRNFRPGEFIFRRRHGQVVSNEQVAYLPYAPRFIRDEFFRRKRQAITETG
jgi:hypothetical protein